MVVPAVSVGDRWSTKPEAPAPRAPAASLRKTLSSQERCVPLVIADGVDSRHHASDEHNRRLARHGVHVAAPGHNPRVDAEPREAWVNPVPIAFPVASHAIGRARRH